MENQCERCENEAQELHVCPFQDEINDDRETLCNCCSACQDECCMDI